MSTCSCPSDILGTTQTPHPVSSCAALFPLCNTLKKLCHGHVCSGVEYDHLHRCLTTRVPGSVVVKGKKCASEAERPSHFLAQWFGQDLAQEVGGPAREFEHAPLAVQESAATTRPWGGTLQGFCDAGLLGSQTWKTDGARRTARQRDRSSVRASTTERKGPAPTFQGCSAPCT